MNTGSLVASAAINFGLAFFFLSLFSILKKQPSNAPIYYARRLSKRQPIPSHHSFTLCRFLPSISWIHSALRVTEDDVIQFNGLDALIIIRLFKFGIRFFGLCSLLGLIVILPINYGDESEASTNYHSLDVFTISNISTGSNRLWVHFFCLWVISFYALYTFYIRCDFLHHLQEYDEIQTKRIQQLQKLKHRPEQFTVLIRQIPFCVEHKAYKCSIHHLFYRDYRNNYHSSQIVYDGRAIEDLLDKAQYVARNIEELKERSTARKHQKEECLLYDASPENEIEMAPHMEKLREMLHKIRQLQDEESLKEKELPIAFATFKSRCAAALAAQSQQHANPLLWITEMAPEPRDVSWSGLAIPIKILPFCKIGVVVLASLLTIFFAVPVTAVQGIAKIEKLKKWFPPAMAIELIPGLSAIVTGYLPSAILNGFIYIVPLAMRALTKLGGSVSRSKEEIKACNMSFYFLLGNVFFLSLISGSLFDAIGEYITHPRDIPNHLASAVSAQADFFVTYILTNGLSYFSFEILQPSLLLWAAIESKIFSRAQDKPYVYSLRYFAIIPSVSLSVLIGMVYAVVAPLLLPFLVGYFFLGYIVYLNQIEDVYQTRYETCGQYWPYIHHYILVGVVLMQITMIGLFGLKLNPAAAIATIPLLLFTIMFNEYCKIRFFPTFRCYPIQSASDSDEEDYKCGQIEANYDNAARAYCQPILRSSSKFISLESTLMQPLVSSF